MAQRGMNGRRSRRGNALLVTAIVLPALFGVISLTVDYGRVQLTKSELQTAADAAARYAATGIHDGTAISRAIAAAGNNKADGAAVQLSAEDVETGFWNSETRSFSPGQSPANAVRVTARRTTAAGNPVRLSFGSIIGKPTCDVQASAIALLTGSEGTPTGFVGLEKFEFGNNFYGNSYNSSLGNPGGTNLRDTFGGTSNGKLKFDNNTEIYGDLTTGPSGSVEHGNHFDLSGSVTTLSSNVTQGATESPTVGSSGALNRGNNQTVTLAAGTYHYSSITFGNNGKIVTTGPVTIYVSGDFVVGNSFTIDAHQNRPSNVKVRLYGTGKKVDSGNNFTATAEFYGPGFEFNTGNNLDMRGSMVAKHIKGGNNAKFYADTNSNDGGSGGGGSMSVATVN